MTVDHFIVFIGAGASLATELSSIEKRFEKSRVVAPAVKKEQVGTSEAAIRLAANKLYDELSREDVPSQVARLYLWMYNPTSAEQFDQVWKTFGHASWIETIPITYVHQVKATKVYLQDRMNEIQPLVHEISSATYSQRKSSPLALPLRNFTSPITKDLRTYWYNDLDKNQVSRKIRRFKNRYLQTKKKDIRGYRDDKALIFKPAEDTECHGKPHPIGSEHKAYFCGRFRYGISLFPGFHFDVSTEKSSTIQCELRTASGNSRLVRGKRYVNIFPNDFILPEK